MSHGEGQPVVVVERSSGVGAFLLGALLGAGAALLRGSGMDTNGPKRGLRIPSRAREVISEKLEKEPATLWKPERPRFIRRGTSWNDGSQTPAGLGRSHARGWRRAPKRKMTKCPSLKTK